MNTMRSLLVCFLLTMSSKQLVGQTNEKSILLVCFYESAYDDDWNKVIVTENDKKIEEIKLTQFNFKNIETVQLEKSKVLTKYRKLEYQLISESKTNTIAKNGANVILTSYTFQK